GREGDVATRPLAALHGGDVGLVWGFVGREADVAVDAEHPPRSELRLQLGEEREHRPSHASLVGVAVGLEVPLRVVELQADEEALRLLGPALERVAHLPNPRPPPASAPGGYPTARSAARPSTA